MRKLTWKKVALFALAAAGLAALANFSPGYTYVSVRGPDGDVTVEKAGFGPQSVHVETPGASIKSNTR